MGLDCAVFGLKCSICNTSSVDVLQFLYLNIMNWTSVPILFLLMELLGLVLTFRYEESRWCFKH